MSGERGGPNHVPRAFSLKKSPGDEVEEDHDVYSRVFTDRDLALTRVEFR